jgi:hypothetical protein
VQAAVHARLQRGLKGDARLRRVAELSAEVAARGRELAHDGRRRAEPHVEFLQHVVVDQVELDVLVAPTLAHSRVGLAEQVKLRALLVGVGRFDFFGSGLLRRGRLHGRLRLRAIKP